jgi:hypothetical protein
VNNSEALVQVREAELFPTSRSYGQRRWWSLALLTDRRWMYTVTAYSGDEFSFRLGVRGCVRNYRFRLPPYDVIERNFDGGMRDVNVQLEPDLALYLVRTSAMYGPPGVSDVANYAAKQPEGFPVRGECEAEGSS